MNWLSTLALAPLLVPQEATRGIISTDEVDEAPGQATYGRRHAVIVGIDDYADPGFPALSRAKDDAKAVAQVLHEQYGFDDDDMQLLLDGDATKARLERALEVWLCDTRVGKRDLVVIYFAGHGVTRTDALGIRRGYLVPEDATLEHGEPVWSELLGMSDLEQVSELIPAKHVLFVLDCCFGGLVGKRSALPISAGLGNRARQVITAGDADQEVLDGRGGDHSVFTGAFLTALRGVADKNDDRVVTFGELYDYVGTTVQGATHSRQTPQQVTLLGHEGGSVAFFPPGVQPGSPPLPDRLAALERTAEERLEEVMRFSDALLARELQREAEDLWPQVPELMPSYRHWLTRVRRLLERRPHHVEALRRVRKEAQLELVLRDRLPPDGGVEILWNEVSTNLRWRHDTLERMLEDLESLEHLARDVDRRLEFAGSLRRRSIDDHAQAWAAAIDGISDDPRYADLVIEPQLGLVPLGPDPRTGLWEFAHLVTGEVPQRDGSGELVPSEATGVVLVLLPGGSFVMGAQRPDPAAARHDPEALPDEGPPHEVTLAPFLLAKHELTQVQWARFTGANPSASDVETDPASGLRFSGLHPVESVSREDCELWLARMGLALPTEAQWEYAARAGTDTVWPTGDEPGSLAGHANVADRSLTRVQGPNSSGAFEFDDGWYRSAPIGSYAPNAFGLHDTIGNVMEWVADALLPYDVAPRPGTGLRSAPHPGALGVVRGGAADGGPSLGRSAWRAQMPPGGRLENLGVRPVCPIR